MATSFQPVPTYANPVIVDEKTGKSGFNPVWLSWFISLTNGGLGAITAHNSLSGIQGGIAGQRFHLTLAEYQNLNIRSHAAPFAITPGVTPYLYQNTQVYDLDVLLNGSVASVTFSRDNVTFFPITPLPGIITLSPGDYVLVGYVGVLQMTGVPR
jgi:hypothetical protein